jgi:hypothetical protein
MHRQALKSLHRPAQHGLAGQRLILFRQAGAGPLSLAGGDDQDGGFRHFFLGRNPKSVKRFSEKLRDKTKG